MAIARNYLFTLNNPKEFSEEYLRSFYEKSKARYLCGQLEKGEEGTPHLQFFANYAKPIRCSAIKKIDKRLHIQVVKINNGADDYCLKE